MPPEYHDSVKNQQKQGNCLFSQQINELSWFSMIFCKFRDFAQIGGSLEALWTRFNQI